MKASDLILHLGKLLVEHGDLEVKLGDQPGSFDDEYQASRYVAHHEPVTEVYVSGWKYSATDPQFILLE